MASPVVFQRGVGPGSNLPASLGGAPRNLTVGAREAASMGGPGRLGPWGPLPVARARDTTDSLDLAQRMCQTYRFGRSGSRYWKHTSELGRDGREVD